MTTKNDELVEVSPKFFTEGLVGMFMADDVEKVEINITLHKKKDLKSENTIKSPA